MQTERLAIATTSLVGETLREKALESRATVENSPGVERECRWRVLSQDEEMSRLCCGEKMTLRAAAEWVERTVKAPVSRFILCVYVSFLGWGQSVGCCCIVYLRTSQSRHAVYASLSSRPKHTSRTGAGCSNFWSSLPPGSACVSYR